MVPGTHADGLQLTDVEYDRLRSATETHREELIVRLCGEVGLRAAEITRIRSADRVQYGAGNGGCFLTVHESPDGNGETTRREAFVPPDVAGDLDKYVRSNDIGETEPIVDVSTRRVQMLVDEVAERAAERHDRPGLARVNPSTLRRLFARRLLFANGVDPNVVFAVGGWERLDSLVPDLESPGRGAIVDAFESIGGGSTGDVSARLSSVVEAISAVGEVIDDASGPAEVQEGVTDWLAGSDAYAAAWVARLEHHRDGIAVVSSAGEDIERAAMVALESLVNQAIQSSTSMVAPVGSGNGGSPAQFAAIPITDGATEHGALVVLARDRDAFDGTEREALRDLGRRIGFSITAVKHRRLLSDDSVLRLAVSYDDREAVFVDLSTALGCSVDLEGVVPAESGDVVSFVRVEGGQPGTILEHVTGNEATEDARLIRSFEEEALIEVVLPETSPVGVFAGHGGKIVDLTVAEGRACLVGEFSPGLDIRKVIEAFGESYPSVELHSKQERAEPTDAGLAVKRALEDDLTDKQRSVLRGAYHSGYFEWPRGSTAEELADSMDVSSPTLHNHLRRAQQKLVGTALDEQ
ncbi:MAG: bacterio-opsin activator domain-containing protein [Haloarculaceae archaeon]